MRSNDLLDIIGEAKDEHVHDAKAGRRSRMPRWAKWSYAAVACLCIVIGGVYLFDNMGGRAGGGGDSDLVYMNYVGPVLPLTVQGDPSGITAVREVNFDFSPYRRVTKTFETSMGEIKHHDVYESEAIVTDTYTLANTSGEDRTVTLLYPCTGDMRSWEYYPDITVDGQPAILTMAPGPYSGGFRGVTGSANEEKGSVNTAPPDSFEDYRALLGDGSYLNDALDVFPSMDVPVVVYRLHDFVYSKTTEDVNPTLSMDFYIDHEKTCVLSYGMNGGSFDYESGFCSRRTSAIEYRPDVAENRQHPDDGYVIVLGEDLDGYTVQGYKDGSCDAGEELNDLGCTVTRYECTLGEVLSFLMDEYWGQLLPTEENRGSEVPDFLDMELYYGLTAELLDTYGLLGELPVERYDDGMLENVFSAVINDGRVLCFSFNVTIPAGENVTVEAVMRRDGSCDHVGRDKDKDGYDMATLLGSCLTFTVQNASISGCDEIEIVGQNFGFDPGNGITEVELDLDREHYYLEVRKAEAR